jgi:hypothetical protein
MDSSSQNNLPGSDTGIRRSERCRTVSSIYAKSIDEFKKVKLSGCVEPKET